MIRPVCASYEGRRIPLNTSTHINSRRTTELLITHHQQSPERLMVHATQNSPLNITYLYGTKTSLKSAMQKQQPRSKSNFFILIRHLICSFVHICTLLYTFEIYVIIGYVTTLVVLWAFCFYQIPWPFQQSAIATCTCVRTYMYL